MALLMSCTTMFFSWPRLTPTRKSFGSSGVGRRNCFATSFSMTAWPSSSTVWRILCDEAYRSFSRCAISATEWSCS
eukprot:851556-Prorocentrum_lima.AAC.1